jgi:hypothetical protein
MLRMPSLAALILVISNTSLRDAHNHGEASRILSPHPARHLDIEGSLAATGPPQHY